MNVYWAIPYSHIFQGKTTEKPNTFFRFSTIDCVTLETHKFTIKQEKNENISICGLDTNIKPPCIMCGSVHRGCSVHWGNLMSILGVLNTLEGTMSASREWDIMNALGDVQYIGGYHDACGGYHEYIEGCSVHQGIS